LTPIDVRRFLSRFLTGLSVLAFGVVVGLWARSWISFDSVLYAPPPTTPQQHVSPSGVTYTAYELRGGSVSSHRGAVQAQWQVSFRLVDDTPRARPLQPEGRWRFFSQPLARSNEAGFLDGPEARGVVGFWVVRRTTPAPLRPGQRPDYDVRDVFVPYWFLAAVTGVLPLLQLVRALRRRARRRRGLCVHCGYDLRETSGRCPECGTTAAPARRA
jgi:hypothetical protein